MSYKGDGLYSYCDVCGHKVQAMDCGCTTECGVCKLADEVIIEGKHGKGRARKDSFGDDYDDVQNEINRRLGFKKRY